MRLIITLLRTIIELVNSSWNIFDMVAQRKGTFVNYVERKHGLTLPCLGYHNPFPLQTGEYHYENVLNTTNHI